MKSLEKVLVTAGGSAVAQGIIKSIKKSDLDCEIVVTNTHYDAAGLYRGDVAYLVPPCNSKDYIGTIIDICKNEKVQAVLIGVDYELRPLSENRELIERESGAKVIVSPPEIIKISDDKWLTNKFLEKNGFPYIPSVLASDAEKLAEIEGFPLIVKPRVGDASKDIFKINNMSELREKVDFLLENTTNAYTFGEIPSPIIQKYMGNEDDEFTSTTVVFDNRSYGVISMRRKMRFGGHTTTAKVIDFPEVDGLVKKVSEKLNPFGPCNFQSRLVNGIPYIFEINCRFSGTTSTCALFGFNNVEASLKKAILGEEIKDLTHKKGYMFRHFHEVYVPLEDVEKINRDGFLKNPSSEINQTI
jgi:carbamoyl-phosphate synthase large subunit